MCRLERQHRLVKIFLFPFYDLASSRRYSDSGSAMDCKQDDMVHLQLFQKNVKWSPIKDVKFDKGLLELKPEWTKNFQFLEYHPFKCMMKLYKSQRSKQDFQHFCSFYWLMVVILLLITNIRFLSTCLISTCIFPYCYYGALK